MPPHSHALTGNNRSTAWQLARLCRRHHPFAAHLALLALLALVSTAELAAQQPAQHPAQPPILHSSPNNTAPLPTLTTSRAAHRLTIEEAMRGYPVRLRVVVTYFDTYGNQSRPTLFVSDSSGSVFVSLAESVSRAFKPGDLLEVSGVSGMGYYAPIVTNAQVRVLGRAPLPKSPPKVQINDVLSGLWDGEWVEIEGIVYAVRQTSTTISLSLAMKGGILSARTVREPGVDYSGLLDSKILLRGNAAPSFNHQGQITGGKLLFPGMSAIKIEQSPSGDPFALPVQHPNTLLRYTPKLELQHRAHLQGAVTLYWPGRLLCIDDQGRGICAEIEQATPIQLGQRVDIVGFPVVGEFTPTLLHAVYIPADGGPIVAAQAINSSQALAGLYDERLVSIEGKVIGNDDGAADPTIVLASGTSLFYAVLPRKSAGDLTSRLQVGSWVRLTGVCSLQSDNSADPAGSSFPVAKSFRILLRSEDDMAILKRPSWWNATHTLRVLALALALALFAVLWVALLSRRIKQQREVIRGQLLQTAALKDAAESATIAAEFHAAHDELTGTLNRRSIFAALRKEFDAAAGSGTMIGVIMIDLDHFKRVNDTHGHLAGDEILRETVGRVGLAVRASDLVGRYGGEEFIVILPECSKLQLQSCAERIRLAISDAPMMVGTKQIAMTASFGTTVIVSPCHSMIDALAAADSALYQAKHCGRNRVVLKDLATGEFEETFPTAA